MYVERRSHSTIGWNLRDVGRSDSHAVSASISVLCTSYHLVQRYQAHVHTPADPLDCPFVPSGHTPGVEEVSCPAECSISARSRASKRADGARRQHRYACGNTHRHWSEMSTTPTRQVSGSRLRVSMRPLRANSMLSWGSPPQPCHTSASAFGATVRQASCRTTCGTCCSSSSCMFPWWRS